MSVQKERRAEPRIRFSWPLWFGYEDNGPLMRGQVVDLSCSMVRFSTEQQLAPPVGHHLLVRFSFPQSISEQLEMGSYYHWAEVTRLDDMLGQKKRVTMRLHQPLSTIAETFAEHGEMACSA